LGVLIHNPAGHYRFLRGIAPYSCGVVADAGWEIVRVTPPEWLPWQDGFRWMDSVLAAAGLPRAALCALELRSPQPFTMAGFIEFNQGYCAVLEEWRLLINGLNPIARTNVAPALHPPATPSLHAFSYVRPSPRPRRPSFVVAGAGELREGTLVTQGIVRSGETSPDALKEKAEYVLETMTQRLHGLGRDWSHVTAIDVYTIHPLDNALRTLLLDRIGSAGRHGLCWHITRPPVIDIEFEMDVRGVAEDQFPAQD